MQINQDTNRRVAYFYNSIVGGFKYGKSHPMKPKRVNMTHSLILSYDMYQDLDVYMNRSASKLEMQKYHDSDYIEYLSRFVCPISYEILKNTSHPTKIDMLSLHRLDNTLLLDNSNNFEDYHSSTQDFPNPFFDGNFQDSPLFPGVFTFSQLLCGASIDSAHLLMDGCADVTINWAGGLHHAKKCSASGFCYVNDIVLCILELLEKYVRVLYIDIDVHHGDGVEEAFYHTNRVMTVSFHQYGSGFFPMSGSLDSDGCGDGKKYAVNVPLGIGMNDSMYRPLFRTIISEVMKVYRPEVIVMQCGADSLAQDQLGYFNLSIEGHGECLDYMLGYGIPIVVLGGGGYNVKNVARCWAYETGICLGRKIKQVIPSNDQYFSSYGPDYQLHFPIVKSIVQQNRPDEIQNLIQKICMNLKDLESVPGTQFHYIPTQDQQEDENNNINPTKINNIL